MYKNKNHLDIKVFISSSMAELEYERELAANVIQELNLSPSLFEIFPSMSQSPSQAFLEEVRTCDIFLLILWKNLRPAVLDEFREAVACAKPVLILLKDLSENERRDENLVDFINQIRGSDLKSTAYLSVYKTYRSIKEFREGLKDSLALEIKKIFNKPAHTLSREEMYDLGTSLINCANRRLYLIQRTPTLFLNLKELDLTLFEKNFLKALNAWIKNAKSDEHKELVYAFCPIATKKFLTRHSKRKFYSELKEKFKKELIIAKNIEEKTHKRLKFAPINTSFSGPICVSDNKFAIWILGDNDAVSVAHDNNNMSNVLVRIIRTHIDYQKSADKILQQLRIM